MTAPDLIRRADAADVMYRIMNGYSDIPDDWRDAIAALPAAPEYATLAAEKERLERERDEAQAAWESLKASFVSEGAKWDEVNARADTAEARVRSLEEALTKAVGRLKWCSGILPSDDARDDTWRIACEVESALSGGEHDRS